MPRLWIWSQWGHVWEATDECFSHMGVCLSVCLSLESMDISLREDYIYFPMKLLQRNTIKNV